MMNAAFDLLMSRPARLRRCSKGRCFVMLGLGLATLSASGCIGLSGALGEKVKAYDGPTRSDTELATVLKSPYLKGPYVAIAAVDGISYGNALQGFPFAVKVLPGVHRLRIYCDPYYARGQVDVTATVQAGKTYQVGCVVGPIDYKTARYPADGTVTEVPNGG